MRNDATRSGHSQSPLRSSFPIILFTKVFIEWVVNGLLSNGTKVSSSGSVRMILRHKMVGIGSGRAAGVSCTEVFGGTGCTLVCINCSCCSIIARSAVFSGFNPDTKAVEALTSCAQRS